MNKWLCLFLLVTLLLTGCGTKSEQSSEIKLKTKENQGYGELTEQYLEGCWVNEQGFVCEYEKGSFTDYDGCVYDDCKITEEGLVLTSTKANKSKECKIEIKDSFAMVINNTTAYRSKSKKAVACMEQLEEDLLGTWDYYSTDCSYVFEFTKDSIRIDHVTAGDFGNLDEVTPYELVDGRLYLKSPKEIEEVPACVKLDRDHLSIYNNGDTGLIYRHGSDFTKQYEKTSELLMGKWFFMDMDRTRLEVWEIDPSTLTINCSSLIDSSWSERIFYELIPASTYCTLHINEKSYRLKEQDGQIILHDEEEGKDDTLIVYDEERTFELINKFQSTPVDALADHGSYIRMGQEGFVQKITFNPSDPKEMASQNLVKISKFEFVDDYSFKLELFSVDTMLEWENATLTFYLDQEKLSNLDTSNLAIGCYRSNGNLAVLNAVYDETNHTLTAPYCGSTSYLLMDQVAYEDWKKEVGLLDIDITPKLLEGVWVWKEGFVCEYSDDVFTDSTGRKYDHCELRPDGIDGFDISNDKGHILIEVMDEETIHIGDITAYKAGGRQGIEYVTANTQFIQGKWKYEINHQMRTISITEDKIELIEILDANDGIVYKRGEDQELDKKYTQKIKLKNCKMIIYGETTTYCSYLQLHNDHELLLNENGVTTCLLRAK